MGKIVPRGSTRCRARKASPRGRFADRRSRAAGRVGYTGRMMTLRRVHVLVSGRVQGVSFRDATRNKAEELDLRGWVRNLVDGRVEALFQGPPEVVEQALTWCHEG